MNYSKLIEKLSKELSSKNAPGPILDAIMFRRLKQFASNYSHNPDLLLVGALLADIRIDEARELGDKTLHVELAIEYAKELITKYKIPEEDSKIILEIISTHHGGEQNYIESKIFKNADNFKFLETRGALHYFGALYSGKSENELESVVNTVIKKLSEKLNLTDLNEETIAEAKELYEYNIKVLTRILGKDQNK